MAERVIVVCDVCGEPATSAVLIEVRDGPDKGRKVAKDLCAAHLTEVLAHGRAPRRGRRRASGSPAPRPTTRKSVAQPKERPGKRITDPAVLQKRRESLAKARRVRAEKRAAAARA
jgi:hypothetical protein